MITTNWVMNVVIAAGYFSVAFTVPFLKFPVPRWRAVSTCISIFFFGCALSHVDLFLHAYNQEPLTVEHMADEFHLLHLSIQATTVFPAVFGLWILRAWITTLLHKIEKLEALVVEASARRKVGSAWGATEKSDAVNPS